jgi:AcrR family transcriptional regulator
MRAVNATKQKLLDGAINAIREHGVAGVSARTIAAEAGVNQALVFYHYGSVHDLLAAACTAAVQTRVAVYTDRFAKVRTLGELLELGKAMHEEERELGNVKVLAQLLAGAQIDEKLAAPTADALNLWGVEIEATLERILAGSPFAEVADVRGLSRAISAAFIGLELYEGVDPQGAQEAMAALEQLAVLVEVVDDLGPLARRALRSRVSKARSR